MRNAISRSSKSLARVVAVRPAPGIACLGAGRRRAPSSGQVDDYFALKSVNAARASARTAPGSPIRSACQDLENGQVRDTECGGYPTVRRRGDPMTAAGQLSLAAPVEPRRQEYLTFLSARMGTGARVRRSSRWTSAAGRASRSPASSRASRSYEWSPDGKRLALVIRDPEPSPEEAPLPWVIDRLTFKADYVGYLNRQTRSPLRLRHRQ